MEDFAQHEDYINGLVRMASACSDWIGRSEISAVCLPKEGTAAALASAFGVSPETAALTPVPETLPQVFAQWLGGKEKKLCDGLLWLLDERLGEPGPVYRPQKENAPEKLSWSEGGNSRYYFVEDFIVVFFENGAVCFYVGNNE